jgi:hypothetical protein
MRIKINYFRIIDIEFSGVDGLICGIAKDPTATQIRF